MATTFSDKCKILGQVSVNRHYVNGIPDFLEDFVNVNEFILTLAWCISKGYAEANDKTISLIDEAYQEYSDISMVTN